MLKAVFVLPRRADLTHDEFMEYWRSHHREIVWTLPGLRRCVLSETISAPDGELPCDALAELWFDDIAAVRVVQASPEARACEESLAQFVDMPHWQVFLSREEE